MYLRDLHVLRQSMVLSFVSLVVCHTSLSHFSLRHGRMFIISLSIAVSSSANQFSRTFRKINVILTMDEPRHDSFLLVSFLKTHRKSEGSLFYGFLGKLPQRVRYDRNCSHHEGINVKITVIIALEKLIETRPHRFRCFEAEKDQESCLAREFRF